MYEKLCSYENLLAAFYKARRGKTQKPYVLTFEKELDLNLRLLQTKLQTYIYRPKPLKTFIIRDPKTRKISKSRFRDRIIHHALINIIGSIFEKRFIHDSYANQLNKGTLKAVERFNVFKRKVSRNNTRACYVLKADIRHYFEEVDHAVLLQLLAKYITDERVLWLIKQILANAIHLTIKANFEMKREREILKGMPLGSHTSQFFANVYLNELDQFVKHVLKVRYYIRYVDDFVIFSHSKNDLELCKNRINEFLATRLLLQLHPEKSDILRLTNGVSFLGYRIFYHHTLLRKRNIRVFERKMRHLRTLYHEHQVSRDNVVEQLEGWLAYAGHANTYLYRKSLLRKFNRFFPFKIEPSKLSKKSRNFYKKVAASRLQFSTQKTLALFKKGLSTSEIARTRGIKEGTVWEHIAHLIEHGWLSVWTVLPRKKIIIILPRIKKPTESLIALKSRIAAFVSFDEIACVRAHLIYKEKIKQWLKKKRR